MKQSRFSEQRIAFILRRAEERMTVEDVRREAGISQATPELAEQIWRVDVVGDEATEAV